MRLLDDTNNRGSDANATPSASNQQRSPQNPGDSFVNGEGQESDIDKLIRKSRESAAKRGDNGLPDNPNVGEAPAGQGAFAKAINPNLRNNQEGYQSQTAASGRDMDFKMPSDKSSMADRFKKLGYEYGKGKNELQSLPGKYIGEKILGDKGAFLDGSEANRKKVKEKVQDKTEDYLKDKIGDKIGNKIGNKLGSEAFKKGLEKGAGKAVKEGAKKVAKEATKEALEVGAKQGVKVGAKAGINAGIKGLEGLIDAAGIGSAPETFGIGLILSFLLNIAISLGVSDAIDAGFELAAGDIKQARFHAIRAAMRVGMFVVLLINLGLIFSVGGIVVGIPLLFIVNIYVLIGLFFPDIAIFQGLSKWWEIFYVIVMDIWASIIFFTVLAVIFWFICGSSGVGSGSVADWIAWLVAKTPSGEIIKWLTGIDYDAISQFCSTLLGS